MTHNSHIYPGFYELPATMLNGAVVHEWTCPDRLDPPWTDGATQLLGADPILAQNLPDLLRIPAPNLARA